MDIIVHVWRLMTEQIPIMGHKNRWLSLTMLQTNKFWHVCVFVKKRNFMFSVLYIYIFRIINIIECILVLMMGELTSEINFKSQHSNFLNFGSCGLIDTYLLIIKNVFVIFHHKGACDSWLKWKKNKILLQFFHRLEIIAKIPWTLARTRSFQRSPNQTLRIQWQNFKSWIFLFLLECILQFFTSYNSHTN